MKVLVVSLLRLGDVILTLPVARGFKTEVPGVEVHYLIHDDLRSLGDILADVDKVHFFPRKSIQNLIQDCDEPAFAPWQLLESFFRKLNNEKFDRVVNLTHTHLSRYVVGQIEADHVQGAHTDESGAPAFGSPWFRLLDQWSIDNGRTEFHYADVFWHGSGLGRSPRRPLLRETANGRAETLSLLSDSPFICVQALTSDLKKNWGVERFAATVRLLSKSLPNFRFLFLCAPSEKSQIEPHVKRLQAASVPAEIACVSLSGLVSVLKRARLLLTGDTGVKHLASSVGCQVVELSLGSSSITRTGVLLEGSLILQSLESCTPCRHSDPCHRESQFCARSFSPEDVSQVTFWLLAGARSELQKIAHQKRTQFQSYEIVRTYDGDWMPRSLQKNFVYDSICYQLLQASWKIFAMPEGSERRLELSRYMFDLQKEIDLSNETPDSESAEEVVTRVRDDLRRMSQRIRALRTRVFWAIRHGKPLEETLREVAASSPALQGYSRRFEEWRENIRMGEFVRMRRLIDLCEEVILRTDIEVKILEMLSIPSTTKNPPPIHLHQREVAQ
ncbi:MAG: glycosyltransferase family 9 protein [Bdellovibrionales bacterium]|nr:glycosyltransferase family 9 protein [Bdellovibrionales bacterium]